MSEKINENIDLEVLNFVAGCGLSFPEIQLAVTFWKQVNVPGAQMRSEIDWPKVVHDWSGPAQGHGGWANHSVTCRKCGMTNGNLTILKLDCTGGEHHSRGV